MENVHFPIKGKNRVCNIWLYPENNLTLENLKLEPFDIIICDGPYGILEPECKWDNFDLNTHIGRERFRQYYRTLFDVCLKYLKDSGSLFIFNYPEGASIIKSILDEEYPIHFRKWLSWIYENHFDFDSGTNFQKYHESILYYTKKDTGFIFHGDNIPDILSYPLIKIESNLFKDGEKPLNVIRYLLKATCTPGGRLLSLFAGSGTDLLVAAEYDMDAIGFEFNHFHIEIIIRRLKERITDESSFEWRV